LNLSREGNSTTPLSSLFRCSGSSGQLERSALKIVFFYDEVKKQTNPEGFKKKITFTLCLKVLRAALTMCHLITRV